MKTSYFTTTMLAFILFISTTIVATATGGELNSTSGHDSTRLGGPTLDPTLLSYKLSIQWPRGYCKTKGSGCERAIGLPDYFTLHGFWPIYRGKCTDSTAHFQLSEVKDLQERMVRYWPNLKAFGDVSKYPKFWKHEWDAHGTRCSIYNVHDYFSRSLDLLAANDVQETLGLTGTGKPLTTVKEVKEAFKGREPYLYCKYGSDGKSYYFYQIEFCLDDKKAYFDCPAKRQGGFCKENQPFSYGDTTVNGFIFLPQLQRLINALPLGV